MAIGNGLMGPAPTPQHIEEEPEQLWKTTKKRSY